MKKIDIYTDGACSGNPGKGGWAAVLVYNSREKEISGSDKSTTNNRMELTAVIEALKALKEPCEVTLTTDSKYVCDAINKGWVYSWKKNKEGEYINEPIDEFNHYIDALRYSLQCSKKKLRVLDKNAL